MKKKIMTYDVVLVLLIWASILIVVLFVDFSSNKKAKPYNVYIYKTYYLYDDQSKPISLTYDMVELDKDASFNIIITKMFDKIKEHFSKNLELLSYEKNNNTLNLKINENIFEQKILLDCIINSYTNILDIDTVNIIYDEEERSYQSNLKDYYVNSPLQNNLLTFLYKDSNYSLLYHDIEGNTINLSISKIPDERTVYLKENNNEIRWNVKSDGVYIDGKKVLTSSYKVGDTYENNDLTYKIERVLIDDEDILNITVSVTSSDTKEILVLKQGIGLFSYEKYNSDDSLIEKYTFYKRKIKKVS